MRRLRPLNIPVALLLAAALSVSGCASLVQVRPPYEKKLRIGDDVNITVGSKIHQGRVVYVDKRGIVIKTGKVIHQYSPVKSFMYTTQLTWEEIENVRVHGILDRRGKLISEEEIKVNKRTGYRKFLMFNGGLLGFAASYAVGVMLQDLYFPPLGEKPLSSLNRGRAVFWLTWVGGTVFSTTGGYLVGGGIDRRRAIQRVEQIRSAETAAHAEGHP